MALELAQGAHGTDAKLGLGLLDLSSPQAERSIAVATRREPRRIQMPPPTILLLRFFCKSS